MRNRSLLATLAMISSESAEAQGGATPPRDAAHPLGTGQGDGDGEGRTVDVGFDDGSQVAVR